MSSICIPPCFYLLFLLPSLAAVSIKSLSCEQMQIPASKLTKHIFYFYLVVKEKSCKSLGILLRILLGDSKRYKNTLSTFTLTVSPGRFPVTPFRIKREDDSSPLQQASITCCCIAPRRMSWTTKQELLSSRQISHPSEENRHFCCEITGQITK